MVNRYSWHRVGTKGGVWVIVPPLCHKWMTGMTLKWDKSISNDANDCQNREMRENEKRASKWLWNERNDYQMIWVTVKWYEWYEMTWMTFGWDWSHEWLLNETDDIQSVWGQGPSSVRPRPPPFVPTLCQEYRLTIGLGGSGPTIAAVSFCNYNYHDSYHFPVILWHPSHSSLIPIIPHSSISFSSHSHHSTLIHLSLAPFQSFQGHFT